MPRYVSHVNPKREAWASTRSSHWTNDGPAPPRAFLGHLAILLRRLLCFPGEIRGSTMLSPRRHISSPPREGYECQNIRADSGPPGGRDYNSTGERCSEL